MFGCIHAPGNLPLLLKCAGHFSPLLEETSPDTVTFDVRGLNRMVGTPEQIAASILARVGVQASVAIASNPDAAVHAALGFAGVTVIAPGSEAEALAPLPLYLLGGSPEFARNLHLWGVRTFGEFAALPPIGIVARLGAEGERLQRLARGLGHRQLRLHVDPQVFREERELEDSIALLEPLLLVLASMLDALCERLRFHGRSTNEVHLRLSSNAAHNGAPRQLVRNGEDTAAPCALQLERAADHSTALRLPVPMLDPKVLLKLLQLELNERPPQAPVERIHLELAPAEPRATQHSLFLPSAPVPEKLEITLARIRALVGAENVGSPRLLDTHRPDAHSMESLTGGSLTRNSPRDPARTRLALRRFRPPHPATVWCTDGRPARIYVPRFFPHGGSGTVVACAGPWRGSGDWWTHQSWKRQEWDVEIAAVGVFRLSSDEMVERWFLDGDYD